MLYKEQENLDHIPTLRELMPKTAGLPGVKYGIVALVNQKAAQDSGWDGVADQRIFTIEGPKGSTDAALICNGEPAEGMSPDSGARRLYLDQDLYRLTGLWQGLMPKNLREEFEVDDLGESVKVVNKSTKTDVKVSGAPSKRDADLDAL